MQSKPKVPPQQRVTLLKLPHLRQRGAALLTAMVIVTLVATLAAGMVWEQWRAVQVEAGERARMQAAWILGGAVDWARLILREDARNGGADSLDEPWATPLAETPLATFLAADKEHTDDAPEAFLSGSITDAQARYNLRNVTDDAGKLVPAELKALQRLCQAAGLSPDVADRLAADWARAIVGDEEAPLLPRSVAQLTWLGLDAETVRLLTPLLVVLPARSPEPEHRIQGGDRCCLRHRPGRRGAPRPGGKRASWQQYLFRPPKEQNSRCSWHKWSGS